MNQAIRGLLGLILTLSWVATAEAQEANVTAAQASTDREARALFDAGSVAFGEGRYESALRHFENAYALSPRPGMLFNIATTYDRLQRAREALDYYRRYLAAIPDAANCAEAEARIAALEATAEVVEPPAETPPAAVSTGSDTDLAPVVLLISGGVVVLGGAVTLALGLADQSAVESARGVPYDAIRAQYERAPLLQGVGGAAIGVGVALAAVGGLMLSLTPTSETRISLRPNGVSLEGTF